ncbi:MAG: hypothetical protein AABZ12_02235 [Planctomycetota bacterium]
MNPSQIVLKLVLDAVRQPLELDSFERRLMIQKKVYLTQLTGLDLAYRFGWYLHGPYCRELTNDAFRAKEQIDGGEDDYKRETLAPFARKLTGKAETIWANRPDGIDEDDWLELLASLHYLKHIAYMGRNARRDFDEIWQALIDSKPRFKGRKHDAQQAWQQLGRVGLLVNKVLPVV